MCVVAHVADLLGIIHRHRLNEPQCFGGWICLLLQGQIAGELARIGPSEKSSVGNWTGTMDDVRNSNHAHVPCSLQMAKPISETGNTQTHVQSDSRNRSQYCEL
jgi:hypothetical protein